MVVSIVMGSSSDWPTMKKAKDILDKFGVEVHTVHQLKWWNTHKVLKIKGLT